MVIPFEKQILDASKQDKRLATTEFWNESGELPGILNWALKGLNRLYKHGGFTQPAVSSARHNEFRAASNPVREFIEERCQLQPGMRISVGRMFAAFKEYEIKRGRNSSWRQKEFTQELLRQYPILKITTNPRHVDGCRQREWIGLGLF